MAKQFDAFILTINGKGYRIARDLAIGGRRVGWIDISLRTSFGSKDLTGPFCVAPPIDASDLYRREFFQDHDLLKIPQGFTLWHQSGLLEASGEVGEYQAEQMEQTEAVRALRDYCASGKMSGIHRLEGSFSQNWLAFMAGFLDKTQMEMSFDQLRNSESVLPIFSQMYLQEQDYSLRRKREEELKVLGVEILQAEKMQFRREGDFFFFYEDESGMVKAEHFINFLSASDLMRLDPTFYQQVYMGEPREEEGHWQRFDVQMNVGTSLSALPPWIAMLRHWDLPWLEENLIVLRYHYQDQSWSAWARMHSEKFADEKYRERMESMIGRELNQRFYSSEIEARLPRDVSPLKLQSPVIAFPLYSMQSKNPRKLLNSYHACGPDILGTLNSFDLYRMQKKVHQSIIAGDLL